MPRTKTFSIKMADLPNMVDAIFAGDHDDPGWVEMNANDKGRACVDALFPEAHIAWRETGIGAPADWHGFVINIPDVVAEMETAPALAITRGADLDEANPDALASPIRGTDKCEGRSLNEVTALCSFDLADRHARFGLAVKGFLNRRSQVRVHIRIVAGDKVTRWVLIRFSPPLGISRHPDPVCRAGVRV